MLFKHGKELDAKMTTEKEQKKPVESPKKDEDKVVAEVAPLQANTPVKDVSPEALRDLLEKNLKWSQIIYEQNRKINSKLFWTAFANWTRLVIMLAAFAAAAWYLPPIVGGMIQRYNDILADPTSLLKGSSKGDQSNVNSNTEDICNLLPPNLQEGCKAITTKK